MALNYFKEDFLSWITLANLTPLLTLGNVRSLQMSDIGLINRGKRVEIVMKKFDQVWDRKRLESPGPPKIGSENIFLRDALVETVGWRRPLKGLFLQAVASSCGFAPPLILNALLQHFAGPLAFPGSQLSNQQLWVLVCLLLIIPIFGVITGARAFIEFAKISAIVRNIIVPKIFRKSMVINNSSRQEFSTGMILNLIGNDNAHISNFLQFCAEPTVAPFQLAAALALIYRQLGVSMFVGLAMVLVIIPSLIITIGFLLHFRNHKMKFGDTRIKLTNEVLSGIRVLKYYAWEKPYLKNIDLIREQELVNLRNMNVMIPILMLFIVSIPIVMPVVMFYTYVRLGNQLDASKAFTTLSLFTLVTVPVMLIPQYLQFMLTASLSVQRIGSFLLADEISPYIQGPDSALLSPNNDGIVICVKDGSFSWHLEDDVINKSSDASFAASASDPNKMKPYTSVPAQSPPEQEIGNDSDQDAGLNRSVYTLMNINFIARKGQLIAIVGGVGSGKSSFLSSLLGDMILNDSLQSPPTLVPASTYATDQVRKGQVALKGSIAYHAQSPWILNATVKDNILFGSSFDEDRFNAAVQASALEPDIAILPQGLETEIGERGINLSGGQKARISFCRVIYRNSDIVLLDDPLSAVDAHVAEHLFHKGILGALAGKTVILVTHQVHLLDRCDSVILLENGLIKASGTAQELRDRDLIGTLEISGHTDTPVDSKTKSVVKEKIDPSKRQQNPTDTKMITIEEQEQGSVSFSIYLWYFQTGGVWIFWMVLLSAMGASACQSYSTFYLSEWGKQTIINDLMGHPLSAQENIRYLNTYALFSLLFLCGTMFRSLVMVFFALNASRIMHKTLLSRILSAPISFFDTTPLGRILNRFSVDVMQTDEALGYTMGWVIGLSCSILSVIGLVSYSTKGLFLVILPAIFFMYYRIQNFFRRSNTELKRLENISRSPIYSEFQQSLIGIVSLRAFKEERSFVDRIDQKINENTTVMLIQQIIGWWLNIRLDAISATVSFFVAALAVGSPTFLPAEYLGIALQQSFSLTSSMKNMVARSANVDSMMASIERIKHYSFNIELEEPLCMKNPPKPIDLAELSSSSDLELNHHESNIKVNSNINTEQKNWGDFELVRMSTDVVRPLFFDRPTSHSASAILEIVEPSILKERIQKSSPPPDWPSEGNIEFRNVSLRYRDGPLVLQDLSVKIKSREKIGIAGRTGSGKSSLMVSLFRIAPLSSGSIWIDGVDISTIPLSSLRAKLGIIPQDPVIFSETIRYNLDPFEDHSDDKLWDVLQMVNMKETVFSMPKQLQEKVTEGGESLSLGQRQLINIARVILRQPKILVLDEATASVDNNTDELIQRMVKVNFKDCTILTIAHRLHTIIDSDRVMVLDNGLLAEIDDPKLLLARGTPGNELSQGSLFAGMWAQHTSNRNI